MEENKEIKNEELEGVSGGRRMPPPPIGKAIAEIRRSQLGGVPVPEQQQAGQEGQGQ